MKARRKKPSSHLENGVSNVCAAAECNRHTGQSRGYCAMHRKRLARYGTLEPGPTLVAAAGTGKPHAAPVNRRGTVYMARLLALMAVMDPEHLEDEDAHRRALRPLRRRMDEVSRTTYKNGGDFPA